MYTMQKNVSYLSVPVRGYSKNERARSVIPEIYGSRFTQIFKILLQKLRNQRLQLILLFPKVLLTCVNVICMFCMDISGPHQQLLKMV